MMGNLIIYFQTTISTVVIYNIVLWQFTTLWCGSLQHCGVAVASQGIDVPTVHIGERIAIGIKPILTTVEFQIFVRTSTINHAIHDVSLRIDETLSSEPATGVCKGRCCKERGTLVSQVPQFRTSEGCWHPKV